MANLFDSLGINDVLGFAGDFFSAREASKSQQDTNRNNLDQMREQNAFQQRMFENRHFMETEDLKRSGLNPILSAHGSSGSPSGGSMTFGTPPVPQAGESVRSSAKNVSEIALLNESAKTQRSMQNLNRAHEMNANANTAKTIAQTPMYDFLGRGFKSIDKITANLSSAAGRASAGPQIRMDDQRRY